MAWITPKTNWQSGDIVLNSDFNRIEGNIQELKNTVDNNYTTLDGKINQTANKYDNETKAIEQTMRTNRLAPNQSGRMAFYFGADVPTTIKRQFFGNNFVNYPLWGTIISVGNNVGLVWMRNSGNPAVYRGMWLNKADSYFESDLKQLLTQDPSQVYVVDSQSGILWALHSSQSDIDWTHINSWLHSDVGNDLMIGWIPSGFLRAFKSYVVTQTIKALGSHVLLYVREFSGDAVFGTAITQDGYTLVFRQGALSGYVELYDEWLSSLVGMFSLPNGLYWAQSKTASFGKAMSIVRASWIDERSFVVPVATSTNVDAMVKHICTVSATSSNVSFNIKDVTTYNQVISFFVNSGATMTGLDVTADGKLVMAFKHTGTGRVAIAVIDMNINVSLSNYDEMLGWTEFTWLDSAFTFEPIWLNGNSFLFLGRGNSIYRPYHMLIKSNGLAELYWINDDLPDLVGGFVHVARFGDTGLVQFLNSNGKIDNAWYIIH